MLLLFLSNVYNYLIWAARQKEMATSSVTELVQAMKKPRSLSESTNRPPIIRKSEGGVEEERAGALGRRKSENVPPPRRNSHGGGRRTSMQRISEVPEKKKQKSGRRSFMGYNGKILPPIYSL